MAEEVIKKSSRYKIAEIDKPIRYLKNGNAIVTVCASSDEIDTDEEVLDLDSFKGHETMVVSAYHNLCGGAPVNTGAKVIRRYDEEVLDSKDKVVKMMFFEIEVKPTDEVRYCDYGSLERKSNGNLLQEIEKGILAFVSLGFEIGKKIKQKNYTLLKDCVGLEISFLDVRPANIYANVFKNMKTTTKCFCGNAQPGRLVTDIATATEVLKLKTKVSEEAWIALKGEEEVEVTADSYELVRTPEEAKAHFLKEHETTSTKECSCRAKDKEKAVESGEGKSVGGSEEDKPTDSLEATVELMSLRMEEILQRVQGVEGQIQEIMEKTNPILKASSDFEGRVSASLNYLSAEIKKCSKGLKSLSAKVPNTITIPTIFQ